MREIIDGNTACSKAAFLFSEIASIYPITPSSTMASNIDNLNESNKLNLFSDKVKVIELESEAGAAGSMHGALLTGSLATTFTASQGLLLMIPNMYKMAGECLPGVIHVASRTIATHALSIFGDHSDIYATRQTGFAHLCSNSPEESYHMAIIAHLSAIKGSLPFVHFFDGFRTSHEINVVETLNESDLLKLIDNKKLNEFKERSLNVGSKIAHGMAENEDIYFQSVEARNPMYNEMPDIVNDYMEKLNSLANTNYKPFNYYGAKDATSIIIAMGSVCKTIKLVVDEELKKGKKVGMVAVHLYRPFSKKYLEKVIPNTVKKIAVLDRTKEAGSIGEPLYLDVLAALSDKDIKIFGGRYGLSSKNTEPKDIYAVYEMLENNPHSNFTIGIIDDQTKLSLEPKEYKINLNCLELKIYGIGSDGMVSASKEILKIVGNENKYVQGYFEYDSKKSGGVTVSNLRIANHKIEAPYYVKNADITVITKANYLEKYNILESAKDNSVLLINTSNELKTLENISKENYEAIKNKNIKILTIDASKIAKENNLRDKISKIIEVILLSILGIDNPVDILSKQIKESYKTKGEEVINSNINAIKEALKSVKKCGIFNQKEDQKEYLSVFERINHRLGNTLTVNELNDYKMGSFPLGTSKLEKRKISDKVVKWDKEKCISCGMCSLVCPHAVIRPFLIKDKKGIEDVKNKEYNFFISVSEADCTACGLCIDVCPGKNNEKALYFDKFNNEKQEEANYLFNAYDNPKLYPEYTIKGSQFLKPRFEFSGACAGCGETSYIKLLTQLYQDELIMANATGCSSIYGGSAPITPYTIPWANSLFEDNAEFAFGMHNSYELKRKRIKKIINESMESVDSKTKELYQELLNNFDSYEITNKIKNELALHEIPNDLRNLLSYIPKRCVWAVGGDGWAYDIGFSGIDQILSSGENVKILVLDTECYSNTGGQMSKASRVGQVAEFANLGKKNNKKDLFRIAMSYPNCYVGSVSLGANMMHTIKTFKEAKLHNGPSIIICYSPCIEHGIKGGMACSLKEQKLASDVGYTLLMNYDGTTKKLRIESKTPNFNNYEQFLENEVRYKALKIKDENLAEELLAINKNNAIERYNFYKRIEQMQDYKI